jgi:hypothetical protein
MVGLMAVAPDTVLAAAASLLAAAFLVRRVVRLLSRRDGACGCAAAGTRACPAATVARDLRSAARRAVRR